MYLYYNCSHRYAVHTYVCNVSQTIKLLKKITLWVYKFYVIYEIFTFMYLAVYYNTRQYIAKYLEVFRMYILVIASM